MLFRVSLSANKNLGQCHARVWSDTKIPHSARNDNASQLSFRARQRMKRRKVSMTREESVL